MLKTSSQTRVTLLLGVIVLLQAANIYTYRLLLGERRAVDVLQRTFVSYSGLEGRPPLLIVSDRNYTERSLYKYAKDDPDAREFEMTTELDCRSSWRVDEFRLSQSERKRIRDAAVSLVMTQARLLNQDTVRLETALHIVLSRYSEPFPGADYSDDPLGPILSMPCRVDKARYEGTPCWIVTCYGSPRPPMHLSEFSVPVSLDGKALAPRWREEGIP